MSAGASPELVRLLCRAAERALDVDLSAVAARAVRDDEREEVVTWPGEHYRLLTALAEVREARAIVEIGTFTGASALSFLAVEGVERVTTYDVVAWDDLPPTLLRADDFGARLDQRLIDLSDDVAFAREASTLAAADLVFVDGPKDGAFEHAFLPKLLSLPVEHEQLIVLDDVRVMPMLNLWRSLPLAKLDAGGLGHWSGTGLVLRVGAVGWHPPSAALGGSRRHQRGRR